MFDDVPTPVGLVAKSEAKIVERSFGLRSGIDKKFSVVDCMVVAKFPKKSFGEARVSRWKESSVEEFVRFGIDGSVQPVALVVEVDYGFVERDVIRVFAACRL